MGLGQGSLAFGVGFRVSAVVFVVCCLASQFWFGSSMSPTYQLIPDTSRLLNEALSVGERVYESRVYGV